MLIASIPAFILADKWGRRTSVLYGGACLSAIMVVIGSLYAAGAPAMHETARVGVIALVFMFGIVFVATWGIVPKIYASEIQPSHSRAAGNSLGMAASFVSLPCLWGNQRTSHSDHANICQLCNWIVAFITPILLAASAYGAYFFFGGLTMLAVAVLAAYMPETRGRSLESIQDAFRQAGGDGEREETELAEVASSREVR